MNSMTGFGQATRSNEEADVLVEIKTLNGRYLDLKLRVPKEVSGLESELRKELQSRLGRGRVDVFINLTVKTSDQYELNEALVQNYLAVADRVRALGVTGSLDVSTLLPLPGVLVARQMENVSEKVQQIIRQAFSNALEQVVASRRSEGEVLKADLRTRIEQISQHVGCIAGRTEEVSLHIREKLARRTEELSRDGLVDEQRLAQEIVYYSDRADITEEITRLGSHMDHFKEALEVPAGEVAGRRLEFLCQEIGREMNTLLSKSALAGISETAVEAKTEIEKIREQVQNVE